MNYKNLNLKIFENLINDIKLIIDTPEKELIEKRKEKLQKEKELKILKENIINTLVDLEKINSKITEIGLNKNHIKNQKKSFWIIHLDLM